MYVNIENKNMECGMYMQWNYIHIWVKISFIWKQTYEEIIKLSCHQDSERQLSHVLTHMKNLSWNIYTYACMWFGGTIFYGTVERKGNLRGFV